MDQLPGHLITNITSYNTTTYPENEVIIEFDYNPPIDYDDPTGNFSCDITIKLDTNIDFDWRDLTETNATNIYFLNDVRQEINAKLRQLPDYNTIFGNLEESNGLVNIGYIESNADRIKLTCLFAYEKEADDFEDDYFDPINFRSNKGLKMRKAAAFLVAHTIVRTLKYIIPPPETRVQDYLTFDEDGNRINQKGENIVPDTHTHTHSHTHVRTCKTGEEQS